PGCPPATPESPAWLYPCSDSLVWLASSWPPGGLSVACDTRAWGYLWAGRANHFIAAGDSFSIAVPTPHAALRWLRPADMPPAPGPLLIAPPVTKSCWSCCLPVLPGDSLPLNTSGRP